MRQTTVWSSQEDADRYCLGYPTDFGLPRKVLQQHAHPEPSMIMNHSRSNRSHHALENAEALYPRPTLPSLRSQVGEYLPTSSQPDLQQSQYYQDSSPSDFQQTQYYQDARLRSSTGSRRLSLSSSSLGSASAHRSSMVRTPSTDGRRHVPSSALNAHPNYSHSLTAADPTAGAQQPPFTGGGHPQSVATIRTAVSVACTNCRSAHLACSDGRPCRRCVQTGRAATCIDVEPKKRGRPRASDLAAVNVTTSMMQDLSTGPSPSNVPTAELEEDFIVIMSTSLRCARLTTAVVHALGLPLKTVLEQPFSAFIHPDEKQDYARFSIGLLAHPGVTSRPVPVSASRLHQVSMSDLTRRLSGAAIHTRIFRVRCANNRWIPFKFEAYLGSAFGAHPSDRETIRSTYVVLKLLPVKRTTAARVDQHSPAPSSNSSSYSVAEPRRDGQGSMSYYGYDSGLSGGAYHTGCGGRDSQDHRGHRQSFSGHYGHSYDTSRPLSRSGFR